VTALRRAWLPPALVAAAFFLLYFVTLQPSVVGHDAGEEQFVPYVFGIPHYTGYPLYLLLGKLWTIVVPLGSVAWRMNLLSAVCGALAAGLAYLCGKELTGAWLGGLLAALVAGLASLEWVWSTITGVRSLAVVFMGLTLLLAMRWEQAVREGDAKLANRRLLLLALTAGFGVDHHRTYVLLLPFLALYVLLVRWQTIQDLRLAGKALLLFILPLGLYGILPLRAAHGAPFDQFNTATWPGFVSVAIAGTNSAFHLDLTPAQALARLPRIGPDVAGDVAPLALAMAALGLVVLLRRRFALAVLMGGYCLVLGWLVVFWDIHAQDELNLVYLMPAYIPLGLFAAAGLFPPGAARPRRAMLAGQAALVLAVAGSGLYMGRSHFQPPPETLDDFRQNLFEGYQARRLADDLALLPPNASVAADWDQATPLWYAELVDGINKSVAISYPASTLPAVLARAPGPVYLATGAYHPPAGLFLTAAGPYVQVLRQPPRALPDDMLPLGGTFGGEIRLAGLAPLAQPRYGVLPVTLYWQALAKPVADYHVSVRLMPSPNRVAAQRDEAAPVLGLSPTSSWLPGQVTADYYELDLRSLPDATYDLVVVLYQALPGGGFRNLSYDGADRAVVGKLALAGGRISFAPTA